ncbi:MAG: hypothetical protein LBF38_03840 [Deltaproteobacteria bacterium]|jgi:hypothetical protein|nr:hypothetical protein [Deltaproteobacteria bacterium]
MKNINITFKELADEFNHNAQILYKLSQEPFSDEMAQIMSMATTLTSDCQAMIELCLVAESKLTASQERDGLADQDGGQGQSEAIKEP